MTREAFWMQEFSKAATESFLKDDEVGKALADDSAGWADRALAAFDERFPHVRPTT